MTYLPPTFQKILCDTLQAYGMKPADYPPPRPPEEVRQELANQPAQAIGSADAI